MEITESKATDDIKFIRLRILDGKSLEETARVLNTSLDEVKEKIGRHVELMAQSGHTWSNICDWFGLDEEPRIDFRRHFNAGKAGFDMIVRQEWVKLMKSGDEKALRMLAGQ